MVELRDDCARVARLWNGSQARDVRLALAAAFAFHQMRRDGEERLSPHDYSHALDIAAAALSRLIPIYTLDPYGERVAAAVDLAQHRFRGGGAEMLRVDGTIVAPLDIVRRDLLPALTRLEGARIEYVAPQRGLVR